MFLKQKEITGIIKSETEFLGIEFTLKDASKQFVPKQETLEEAADNYILHEDKSKWAKIVQERSYSEEDMRKAYDQGIDDSFDIGFSSKDDTNFNAFIKQFKRNKDE